MECVNSDLELADLVDFNPELLMNAPNKKDRECNAVILMMAHIYNDFKAVLLFDRCFQMERVTPKVTTEHGHRSGMHHFVRRLAFGWYAEFMKFLHEQRKVFEHRRMKLAIGCLNDKYQDKLKHLFELTKKRDVRSLLDDVRNTLAHHYYKPKGIMKGYVRYFRDLPKTDFNRAAFVSQGHSISATRYYFADAAALGYVDGALDEAIRKGVIESGKNLFEEFESIHPCLSGVISSYLVMLIHGEEAIRGISSESDHPIP